jgi:iron(III) transport system substrate-binding protein
LPRFDIESTKTVGLTRLILAESANPRCDLFWNNEVLNTLRLRQKGLLEPFHPSGAADIPAAFKAEDGTWYGFAARARVLLVNTELVAEGDRPASIHDLTAPRWKGKIGLAKPLFGTTATHAACLFAAWGDSKARAFFEALRGNEARILSGNKQVALAVGSGQIAFGLTDTDDAIIEIDRAGPVAIIYPDQADDQLGTLFIPNTLAIIKGGPHPEQAKQLVDFLLAPATEEQLAKGASAQIPLNPKVTTEPKVKTPKSVKAMQADFPAAARAWDVAAEYIQHEFLAAD